MLDTWLPADSGAVGGGMTQPTTAGHKVPHTHSMPKITSAKANKPIVGDFLSKRNISARGAFTCTFVIHSYKHDTMCFYKLLSLYTYNSFWYESE